MLYIIILFIYTKYIFIPYIILYIFSFIYITYKSYSHYIHNFTYLFEDIIYMSLKYKNIYI